jgi:hypothetical protein
MAAGNQHFVTKIICVVAIQVVRMMSVTICSSIYQDGGPVTTFSYILLAMYIK